MLVSYPIDRLVRVGNMQECMFPRIAHCIHAHISVCASSNKRVCAHIACEIDVAKHAHA